MVFLHKLNRLWSDDVELDVVVIQSQMDDVDVKAHDDVLDDVHVSDI